MSAPLVHAKPAGKIVFQKEDSWKEKCFSRIDSHDLNFAVDILLPGCDELPSDLERVLTEQPVFLAQQVPLAKLVTEEFRCCFVKRGKLYGLSQGTAIDSNDCVAILPNGTLILHLTKDTYQELGLEGRLSMFETGTRKHVVEINMASDSFCPGKKLYERVKWCLTDRLNLKFDLLFTWEPNLNTVCPTSIQGYFQANNIICNRIQLTKSLQHIKDLSVPRLCHSDPQNKAENKCSYLDVYEWLGACAVGADFEDLRPDKYISSYTCPDPSEKIKVSVCVSYQGMFTPTTIRNAIHCLRVFRERKGLPWCSVTVHGFMDSPVTDSGREHGFFNNGDNLYTYILFPDGAWIYTALGGKDVPQQLRSYGDKRLGLTSSDRLVKPVMYPATPGLSTTPQQRLQLELPPPILPNSVESYLGCTWRIYFNNLGDNMTLTLYYVTLTSQKPC